jgi:hypothetical protein
MTIVPTVFDTAPVMTRLADSLPVLSDTRLAAVAVALITD